VAVENEEMEAPSVIAALKAASQRGVLVTVTMTSSPTWAAAWVGLVRAGVKVATYPDTAAALYVHAKVVVVDDMTAFVGSQNFSNESLAHNRELGVTTSDAAVVGPLSQTLAADFTGATRFVIQPATTGTTVTTSTTSTTVTGSTTTTMAP
jgi:phosphatidylserine/phosphatidylglycerophosphate/cardiolipin synthase-like enzyme